MQLVRFAIQNYRSISKTPRLTISDRTILIGPNNEGKSNFLRGLAVSLKMIEAIRLNIVYRPRSLPRRDARYYFHREQTQFDYQWERDYPIHLQKTTPNGTSVFFLEFELTPQEVDEFRTEVGSRLNGTLPVELTIGREQMEFSVPKKGPGGPALSRKRVAIAEYVAKRVNFEYIRAVRTADEAQDVVEEMVGRELRAVEEDMEFKNALEQIIRIQRPVLEKLSNSIKETLSVFLPDVTAVDVRITHDKLYSSLRRSCEIIVDDGTPTPLRYKGDGIQSLAALSLMRYASETGSRGRDLLIAIEEPESHLHPRAIHQLRGVLQDLAAKHRLVITTHCPLLIDRLAVRNNIIVSDNKAASAKHIDEIRETLGVRAADNLKHADLVLVVEGEDDRVAMHALLANRSKAISSALQNGALAIEALGGGSNLSYKLALLRDALCLTHAFLDNDDEGRKAGERARSDGLIVDADLNFATCLGLSDSELEDLYDVELYRQMLMDEYRVSLDAPPFRSKKKWSDRIANVFSLVGKRWDDRVEMEVKARVADLVARNPDRALCVHKVGAIDGLVAALEQRLVTIHVIPAAKRAPAPEQAAY